MNWGSIRGTWASLGLLVHYWQPGALNKEWFYKVVEQPRLLPWRQSLADIMTSYTVSSFASEEHPRKRSPCHSVLTLLLWCLKAFLVLLVHPYLGYSWAKYQSQICVASFLHLSCPNSGFLVPCSAYKGLIWMQTLPSGAYNTACEPGWKVFPRCLLVYILAGQNFKHLLLWVWSEAFRSCMDSFL